MAAAGVPFQIAAERRYDRTGDPRRLRRALADGATIFLPQVHQVLPRLMRLIVALRVSVLGPRRKSARSCSASSGRGRTGMGLHHDGPVDAFWLQLEGGARSRLGAPVAPGTPQDLPTAVASRGAWLHSSSGPGRCFHLPPWTPHDVVCHGRSLALSLTWASAPVRGPHARAAAQVAWDVAVGLGGPHTAGLSPSTLDSDPGDRGSAPPRHVPSDDARRDLRPSARRAPAGPAPGRDAALRRASLAARPGGAGLAPRARHRRPPGSPAQGSSPPTRRRSTAGASVDRRGVRAG